MAAVEDSSLVLVTGATGYIATHVIQQLQQEGYQVRGTVRSLGDEEKLQPLHELCPDAKHKLELVEAELLNAESWESAISGCSYVIHLANPPTGTTPANEDDVMKPVVDGTQNVLKACQKAKIKRLVLTSSVVTCTGVVSEVTVDKTYTEEDWGDVEKGDVHIRSKIQAEKGAWDFIKELPEEERFELVVMNPVFVQGPILTKRTGVSTEMVKKLLERSSPIMPKIYLNVVDVRDVAAANIKALNVADAAGQRHILSGGGMWVSEFAQVLAKEFKPKGYNVPVRSAPFFVAWVKSIFDKNMKTMMPMVGKSYKVDNSRMTNVLGVTPREVSESLIDLGNSLIEKDLIKKPKEKKPKKEVAENHVEEKEAEDVKEEKAEDGEDKPEKIEDNKETDEKKTEEKKTEEKKEEEIVQKKDETPEKKEDDAEEKKEEAAEPEPAPAPTPTPAPEETKEEPKEEAKTEEEKPAEETKTDDAEKKEEEK